MDELTESEKNLLANISSEKKRKVLREFILEQHRMARLRDLEAQAAEEVW